MLEENKSCRAAAETPAAAAAPPAAGAGCCYLGKALWREGGRGEPTCCTYCGTSSSLSKDDSLGVNMENIARKPVESEPRSAAMLVGWLARELQVPLEVEDVVVVVEKEEEEGVSLARSLTRVVLHDLRRCVCWRSVARSPQLLSAGTPPTFFFFFSCPATAASPVTKALPVRCLRCASRGLA